MPKRRIDQARSAAGSCRSFAYRLGWQARVEGLGTQGRYPRRRLDVRPKNSIDFRGPDDAPGSRGQYADVALHAGLICLNGPVGMDLDLQLELFEAALDELDRDNDLVNQVLEITLPDPADEIEVLRYKLPADGV